MNNITIKDQKENDDGWQFVVETQAGTNHTVTVQKSYYQKLTNSTVSVEDLVSESFAFLLDNEPASAILAEFDLQDIETYFPEYPKKIRNRLS